MIRYSLKDEAYDKIMTLNESVCSPEKFINSSKNELRIYSDWYKYNEKFYYFKCRYVFEELFMREVARVFELDCVDFVLAMADDGEIGVASENFRTFDKQYYNYTDYFNAIDRNVPSDIIKLADFIKSDEKNSGLINIFSLIALDVFSGQLDRININVILETLDGVPALSPLTDNGLIRARGSTYYSGILGVINLYDKNADNKTEVYQTIRTLYYVPELFHALEKSLDIDIRSYIDLTCEIHGIKIDDASKEKLVIYFDKRKECIDNTLKRVRKW